MPGPTSAPSSRRALARLEQLRDMGTAEERGLEVRVLDRIGRTWSVWRQVRGTEWFERVDAAAPVAPEHAVTYGDIRDAGELVLRPQRAARNSPPPRNVPVSAAGDR